MSYIQNIDVKRGFARILAENAKPLFGFTASAANRISIVGESAELRLITLGSLSLFSIRTCCFAMVFGSLCCSESVCAQGGVCRLRGSVTDVTGAAIPGAAVTLTPDMPATGLIQIAASAAGTFEACSAPASGYTVSVTAEGFAKASEHVKLPAKALALVLGVAGASDEATVTAGENDKVEVDPSAVGTGMALSEKQIADIPLNGRSFTDTLSIAPGVVPISSAQPNAVVMSGVASTPPSGDLDIGALSVSGQRETSNAFRVNGANVQEDVNMGVAVVPTLDSIGDLQVLTAAMDAKYGNQSGGQILVTTKSGSDSLHGSVYDYFRNTALDARNYFSLTRAPFHQNQFGGTLGGSIARAKTYFFVDYQGTRQTQGIDTGLIAVPSAADRMGDLGDLTSELTGSVSGSYFAGLLTQKLGYAVTQGEPYYTAGCATSTCVFPNGQIPASAFSAPAQHLLQYIPTPNDGSSEFSTSSYAQKVRDDKGAVRLDRETRVGQLSGYYFADDYTLLNPYPTGQGGATVPGFNAENDGRAQLFNINLTSAIRTKWMNQAHASYMRNAAAVGQPIGGVGISLASQGFVTGSGTSGIVPQNPSIEGVENVTFNDFVLGVDVTSLFQAENIYEGTDDVTRVAGRHTLAFGVSYHADEINTHPGVYDNGSFSFTGSETGSDFADFLLGIDSSYTQGHGLSFYNRNHYLGLYAQDKFDVSSRLTLSYGLRYDVLPPWSEKYNQLLTLDPNEQSVVFPNAPKGILFPGDPGVPKTLSPTRYANFAPRVSAAWTPKNGTVVRGGYGLYYTAFEGLSAGIMSGNPPYGFTDTSAAPTLFDEPFVTAATGVSVGQRFPLQQVSFGASPSHPNTSVNWANFEPLTGIPAFAKDNVTPYAENYNLAIEHSLGEHTSLTASYVGTQSHHLLVIQEVNPGNPALCLALSQPSEVATGSATCGPFGESSSYTSASGTVYQGTRSAFGPAFGSVNLQRTIANAHDNALEVSARHVSRSLYLQVGYTWSKSIDQSSSLAEAVYPAVVPGGAGASRGLSAFDLTHNFVASYRYTLPVAEALRLHEHERLTGGWQVSGLTRFSTGLPVTLINNNDTSLLGTQPNGINNNGVDEPAYTPGNLDLLRHPRGTDSAFNTGLFALPALGTLGNARRRFFYGPGADNTDLAVTKETPFARGSVEIRAEAFNVFNHSQFFSPAAVNGNISSTAFGQFQTASPPRLMQVAARISF
jgi:hypothetical protein